MSTNGQTAAGVTVPDTKLARAATGLVRWSCSHLQPGRGVRRHPRSGRSGEPGRHWAAGRPRRAADRRDFPDRGGARRCGRRRAPVRRGLGLDSMAVGEEQIVAQLRHAARTAAEAGTTGRR